MRNFILSTFTAADNKSGDIHRLLLAFFGLAFVGFTGWAIYRGQPWEPVTWVTAAGGLLVSGGGALWLKKNTEPPA